MVRRARPGVVRGRGRRSACPSTTGRDYDNAFWDGEHLVFGDGDGKIFERFTKPVDVLAHEFTHAVVEHTAELAYRGQSGALNESGADVFAACLKQRLLGQDADSADWLIGEGIFTSAVSARGLRDMARPGTAYDDPVLGRDPQVGHVDDYVKGTSDHGGYASTPASPTGPSSSRPRRSAGLRSKVPVSSGTPR